AKVADEEDDFTTAKRQRAVAVEEAAKFDMGDPRAVQTLNALANLYRAEGRLDWAETVLGRARATAEVWLGPESPELATNLNNLGALHTNEQKFSEAAEPLKRALAIRDKLLGPEPPEVAATLCHLVDALRT